MKRYAGIIISPLCVMAVFAALFAVNGFFPFGKGCVSWCDMNQQVIPLLCDFKDMLSGKDGFFLSLQNAGGMNFFGVFFFFLSSPFSFLVIFVDKADIPFLMNIMVVLKLSVCALCAAVYFEKRFSGLYMPFKILLSIAYAFCGYGMLFYQNIIWLDIMYLFPLLMLSAELLAVNGRILPFTITLCAVIAVNYYLSYMVFLFIILLFGLYALILHRGDYTVFVRLGLSAVTALLATCAVWLPSLLQYTSSGRTSDIIAGLKDCAFFADVETTVPLLLCTSVIFAAVAYTAAHPGGRNRRTLTLLTAFTLMCVPVFIEPVNRMWHTGSYMSFPVRYGFITVFIGLIICARAFLLFDFCRHGRRLISAAVITVSLLAGGFAVFYAVTNSETLSHYVQTLWGSTESFTGILVIFLCLLSACVLLFALAHKKQISRAVFSVCLCIIILCESAASVIIYVIPAKNKLNLENYTAFTALEDRIDDSGFYRVNMSRKLIDANMTGAIGYNSLGHYTSLTGRNYMKAAKQLGYSGYWMESGNWGGSILSDILLSVKYRILNTADGYKITGVENTPGLGFFTATALTSELPDGNRLDVLGEAFAAIFPDCGNPVTDYSASVITGCGYRYTDGVHSFIYDSPDNEIVYNIHVGSAQTLYFDCYNGFSNALVEPINGAFTVTVNGKQLISSYPAQNNNGLITLGTFENSSVQVRIVLKRSVECFSYGVFGVDRAATAKACDASGKLVFKTQGSTISAEIPDGSAGNLFLSLPYDKGLSITLNGEELEYSRCLTGFTQIYLPSGGTLSISYVPPGLIAGAVISVAGIILLVLLAVFNRRLSNIPEALKKTVFIMFVSVFTLFIILVYIMPVAVNLL